MLSFCNFCLVALSIQIFKINSVSGYVFPEIKFPFPSIKFNLKEFFSMFHMNIPYIKSKSDYLDDLKHIIVAIDGLASKLYKKINAFIQNPDDLLSHFKLHKFSWNWTKWHPDFSCSEFNASGKILF